jgi:hypothetical protein
MGSNAKYKGKPKKTVTHDFFNNKNYIMYLLEQIKKKEGVDSSVVTDASNFNSCGVKSNKVVEHDYFNNEHYIMSLLMDIANNPGGGGQIEITFSELNTLKNNNGLTAGSFYLITDFQTIYDRPDFEDVGYGNIVLKSNLTTVSGPIQPLVVLAISDSEFAPEAWMSSTPGNRYLFDFDLQTTHFTNSPTKGTIYECIDENGNRTGYNHPVIEFIRYEDSNGDFVNLYDKDLTGNTQLFKTFGDSCTLNVLGDVYYNELNIDASTNPYYLSKGFPFGNVISNNSFSNKIGNNNIYIEITGGVISNQIDVFGNTIGGGFRNNTIENDFTNNTIENDFNNNTIENNFNNNTIGNNFNNNTIGNDFRNNTIGNDFNNNTIGNDFNNNTIENDFNNNTIGNNFNNNTIGNNFNNNTIGGGFRNNTIGGGFRNNTIGGGFRNNTIGGGFNNNTTKTSISSTNFTSATHVYQLYTCEIVEVYGSGKKLNYQDANGTLVVADITD